jgi:hypothetical protein
VAESTFRYLLTVDQVYLSPIILAGASASGAATGYIHTVAIDVIHRGDRVRSDERALTIEYQSRNLSPHQIAHVIQR